MNTDTIENTADAFKKFFSADNLLQLLLPVVSAILILVIGHFLCKLLIRVVERVMRKYKANDLLIDLTKKVLNILLHLMAFVAALAALGVSTGGIVAALAAASAAIALSLKDSLSNVASGIILLVTPRFRKEDFISVNGEEGKVIQVDLMHTTILTRNNRQILIPNSMLVSSQIINLTAEEFRRIDVPFPIPYGSDTEKAKQLAICSLEDCPYLVHDETHKTFCEILAFEDSSVTMFVRTWCRSEEFWSAAPAAYEHLLNGMAKGGFHVPFNRLEVDLLGKTE